MSTATVIANCTNGRFGHHDSRDFEIVSYHGPFKLSEGSSISISSNLDHMDFMPAHSVRQFSQEARCSSTRGTSLSFRPPSMYSIKNSWISSHFIALLPCYFEILIFQFLYRAAHSNLYGPDSTTGNFRDQVIR